VVARAIQLAEIAGGEVLETALPAQVVDEVGVDSRRALIRARHAVGHARVLAEQAHVGGVEVRLLGAVEAGIGGAGGVAGDVATLAVPAEVDQVVGRALAEQLDVAVVASRATVVSSLSCADQMIGDCTAPGRDVDLVRLHVAGPGLGGVAAR
jgi:hypothetical protein